MLALPLVTEAMCAKREDNLLIRKTKLLVEEKTRRLHKASIMLRHIQA